MMQEVPKADVVITNPTHFAVALRYDERRMRAPIVVAKGADLIAARIREVADEHRVPIFEAPPLARALFRNVEIGGEIPATLYVAVAQVLTYIYQLKTARSTGCSLPTPPVIDPAIDSRRRPDQTLEHSTDHGQRISPNTSPASPAAPARPPARGRGRAGGRTGRARDGRAAAAAHGAGCAVHLQHRAVPRDRHGGVLCVAAGRVRRVSDGAAAGHAAAAGAERRLHARRAAEWAQRPAGCRPRHPVLRGIRHRRQFCRRCRRVHHSDDHQLRRGHQRLRAHLRSERPLHPGCHAGQTDGHRRRSECRPDHPGRSARTAARSALGSGLLRLHGWRQQVRARRCRRRHPHPVHQHHRRPGDRHDCARTADRGGRAHLHAADDRRWPGHADSGAAAVHGGGVARDPHVACPGHGRGAHPPAVRSSQGPRGGRRPARASSASSRDAEFRLSA